MTVRRVGAPWEVDPACTDPQMNERKPPVSFLSNYETLHKQPKTLPTTSR